MADTFATVDDLQARLDWVLDEQERGVAQGALDDLSDDARFYGSDTWDSDTAPRQAKGLVLRAASRFVRNPDGYTQSRAGDETLMWSDLGEDGGTAHFTVREQKMLSTLAGRNSSPLYSVPLVAYGTGSFTVNTYVPVDGSAYGAAEPRPFPFYTEDGSL